jgi:hypothetical protein
LVRRRRTVRQFAYPVPRCPAQSMSAAVGIRTDPPGSRRNAAAGACRHPSPCPVATSSTCQVRRVGRSARLIWPAGIVAISAEKSELPRAFSVAPAAGVGRWRTAPSSCDRRGRPLHRGSLRNSCNSGGPARSSRLRWSRSASPHRVPPTRPCSPFTSPSRPCDRYAAPQRLGVSRR